MANTPKFIRKYGKRSLSILRQTGRRRKVGVSCHGRAIWYAGKYIPFEALTSMVMYDPVSTFEKSNAVTALTNKKSFSDWLRSEQLKRSTL